MRAQFEPDYQNLVDAAYNRRPKRLPLYDRPLYLQVKAVMEQNKAERHIRGGMATRRKYRGD